MFSTSKLVLNLFSPYLVGSAKSNRWGLSISPLLSTNHQVILEIHRQVTIKFYSLDGNSENTWMRRGNQLVLGFLFYYFVFGLVGTFPSSRSSGALGYSSTQSSTLISLPTLNQTTPSSDRCESNCSMYLIRVLQQLLHSFFFLCLSSLLHPHLSSEPLSNISPKEQCIIILESIYPSACHWFRLCISFHIGPLLQMYSPPLLYFFVSRQLYELANDRINSFRCVCIMIFLVIFSLDIYRLTSRVL